MKSARRFLLALLIVNLLSLSTVDAAPLTGNTGPGGYVTLGGASPLRLWLRGDAGVVGNPVSQWTDQSTFGNHAVPDAPANQPSVGAINGQAAVSFVGTGLTTTTDRLEFPGVTAQSIIIVNQHTVNNSSLDGLIGQFGDFGIRGNGPNAWRGTTTNSGDFTDAVGSTFRVNGVLTESVLLGTSHILSAIRGSATTVDSLGDYFSAGGRAYTGNIGDVVVFNRAMTNVERIITENHESSKYNVGDTSVPTGNQTLGAGDHYTGDLDTNGHFDYGVIGVGSDGATSIVNAGHDGFGIEVGALGTDEWVFAGHAGGSNGTTSSNMPGGQRWERSWFVDSTGVTTADLAFDWNDAGIGAPYNSDFNGLFFRPLNSGFFSLVMVGNVDVGNQRVDFLGVSLPLGDGYFTLGTVPVPEPSTLALLCLGMVGAATRFRRRRVAS